jgi:hypothetical protein
MTYRTLKAVLLLQALLATTVHALSFSCAAGCALNTTSYDSDGLTTIVESCDCDDESHSIWNGRFGYKQGKFNTFAYAKSKASSHFLVTYQGSINGVCDCCDQISNGGAIFTMQNAMDSTQFDSVDVWAYDDKVHTYITVTAFDLDVPVYMYVENTHCNSNMVFTIEEFNMS